MVRDKKRPSEATVRSHSHLAELDPPASRSDLEERRSSVLPREHEQGAAHSQCAHLSGVGGELPRRLKVGATITPKS
jgi:hypothetical protein